MILGYRMSDYQEYSLKVPVSITLAKQTSSILIAGKSGSGKSLSARWYLWQMLSSGESAVYIYRITKPERNMKCLKDYRHMLRDRMQYR